jgi:hypothetical protein
MNNKLKYLITETGIFEKRLIKPEERATVSEDNIIKLGVYTYIIDDKGMTNEDVKIALMAKQTLNIKAIKNMVRGCLIALIISASVLFLKFY